MSVREPTSLRLVREFPKKTLRVASEGDNEIQIMGQSLQSRTKLFLADYYDRQVKLLNLQTGALELAFEEREMDWYVSNVRLLDTLQADSLIVSEEKPNGKKKGNAKRVVIAKKNTDGIYLADHFVELQETTTVCLFHSVIDTLAETSRQTLSEHDTSLDFTPHLFC